MMLIGLLAGGMLAAGPAPAPAPAAAAEPPALVFELESGERVQGQIVHGTRNTLSVRRELGGVQQIPTAGIARIEVTTADGSRLQGDFAGWADGRLAVDLGSEVVWLDGQRVVARAAPDQPEREPARAAAAPAVAQQTVEASAARTVAEPPAARAAVPTVRQAIAAPPAQPAPEASPPPPLPEPAAGEAEPGSLVVAAARAAVPNPAPAAAPPAGPPTVPVLAPEGPVAEGAGEVVVALELSHATPQAVAVVYATVDGAAVDGEDYEAQQGVLTLHPGSTRGELRIPLIDDGETEDEKQLHLFLSTKPESATLPQKWVTVTIRDDDGPGS